MIDGLPRGWIECEMGDVAKVVGGGTPDSQDPENFSTQNGIPWLTPADLSDNKAIYISRGKRFLTKQGFDNSSARLVPKGTVLFSSRAPIGYVAVAANEISTNQGFKSFICADGISSEYIYFWLRFATPMAEELASGTTFAEISGKNAAKIPLRLAPVREQRRIVAKLETLLGKVDTCQPRLANIPILLKRFRQSVLAAVCSGRLTADWREENPQLESATDTLAAHAQRTTGRGRNTRRMKPAKGLTLLDYSDEFPTTWAWLKVRELVEKGAIFDVQDGNHGELYPRAEDFGDAGVHYISAEHVINDRVLIDSAPFLKNEKARQLRIGFAKANDVILTHNATVGRVALLPPGSPDVVLSTSTTYYRVDEAVLLARYLARFLRSHYFQSQLEAVMEQTTRNQVSVTKQVEFGIAIPPVAEQQEIVRRVEALFALADQLEDRYAKAKAHVDKLTQSILAKAFHGELVPQDPNDEPASVLLERIKSTTTKKENER